MGVDYDPDLDQKGSTEADAEVVVAADEIASQDPVDAFVQQSKTLEVDYNALKDGSKHIKDPLGTPKKPVAARISVLNLTSQQYIATSTSFILLSIQRQDREKIQITLGFDEQFLITPFGRDVRVYTLSGLLMNYRDEKDWVSKMHKFYEKYLRASKLAEAGNQAVVHYADRWMRGYFISMDDRMESTNNYSIPFTTSFVVRRDRTIGAGTGLV